MTDIKDAKEGRDSRVHALRWWRDNADGTYAEEMSATNRVWDTNALAWVKEVGVSGAVSVSVVGGGAGGGGAATIADGADVAQGATTDLSSASTVVGILKAIKAAITGTLAVSGTFWQATQPVSGTFWQATQPVSGTFWQATQPVSLATAPTTPVTGTFWQATQPVSLATAPTTPVTGTFFQATQPVSLATNTPDVTDRAARLVGHVTVDSAPAVTGTVTSNQGTANATPWSQNLTQIVGAAPSVTNPLPVRLSDGAMFNFNQATYMLYQTPRVTTAAATDFFDLFNASGSGKSLRILGLYPVVQITAASAIVPSFQFSVIKTSAVGTGGTGHTFEGAAAPAAGALNIVRDDGTDATLPAQVTARSLPTGGATAAKFLFDVWLGTEETNAATYLTQMFNWIPVGDAIKEVILAQGEGIKIRQITATASTGTNFGWLIAFTLI